MQRRRCMFLSFVILLDKHFFFALVKICQIYIANIILCSTFAVRNCAFYRQFCFFVFSLYIYLRLIHGQRNCIHYISWSVFCFSPNIPNQIHPCFINCLKHWNEFYCSYFNYLTIIAIKFNSIKTASNL